VPFLYGICFCGLVIFLQRSHSLLSISVIGHFKLEILGNTLAVSNFVVFIELRNNQRGISGGSIGDSWQLSR